MVYDIAVVGAGPAGSVFARQMADSGRSILLIDGQDERRKKPCGGLLAPDAQKVLAHFDLTLPKSVLADPQIFSVKTIDLGKKTVRYYQRYYMNMDRYAFDRWLLSLVPNHVTLYSGRCLAIDKQDGLFQLTVHNGQQSQCFQSRQIVGADGANSVVRKTFFHTQPMQYVAIQQWFHSNSQSTPFYSRIFDPETSESCSWLMYKDDAVIYGGCFLPQGCRQSFEAQKRRLADFLGNDFGSPVKTEACLVDRPKHFRDFVMGENGVYLVGEAAGLISASSFEGISSAILSGSLLANAFFTSGSDKKIAKRYRRMTRKLRLKLYAKIKKRWFMYTPWVRRLIMKTGVDSIQVQHTE